MNYYKQCDVSKGTTKDIAWIPEELAKVNKNLKIQDEEGWKVDKVYQTRLDEDYVLQRRRDYRVFPSIL